MKKDIDLVKYLERKPFKSKIFNLYKRILPVRKLDYVSQDEDFYIKEYYYIRHEDFLKIKDLYYSPSIERLEKLHKINNLLNQKTIIFSEEINDIIDN